jgi:putative transposase
MPDQMWAIHFQVDATAHGRQIRFGNVVDEFTREAPATTAARSFTRRRHHHPARQDHL